MGRIVSAAVDAELIKEGIFIIDLIDFDFGGGNFFRWAESLVDGAITFNGKLYEPRLLRNGLGTLPFTIGAKGDSTTAEFDNLDLLFTTLINEGVSLQHGRMTVHRLFHNLPPPDNIIANYWFGRVLNFELTESSCVFNVGFGFPELSRRALRRFEHSCNSLFAEDEQCPYNVMAGFGLPQTLTAGTTTSGTPTSITDTGKNFITLGVKNGMHVFIKTKKSRGIIQNVTATTLTVDQWRFNTAGSGDSYIVGPPFTDCHFSKGACINRGMFGPNGAQTDSQLNQSARRYFMGNTKPSAVVFQGHEKDSSGDKKRFSRTAKGNDSIDGTIIPAVFGYFKVRDMIVLGAAAAGDFLHSLFTGGEGRVYSLFSPTVDGFPVDNPSRGGNLFRDDTFFTWGLDNRSNADDAGADLSDALAKQAIGSRASFGQRLREPLDSYLNHPYLFNNSKGDGISLAGLNAMRIRTEPEGGAREGSIPSAGATMIGLMTKMPPGATPQSDDGNVTDYTKWPNHLQIFYNMVTNKRWGAGLDDSNLNLTRLNAESDYCEEFIASTQFQFASINGSVGFSSTEPLTSTTTKNWIFTRDFINVPLVGGQLRITTAGKEFVSTIISIEEVPVLYVPWDGDDWFDPPSDFDYVDGTFIFVADDFPTGAEPVNGDSYQIQPIQRVRRFKANGKLDDDIDIDEMLQSIMENCAGTFVQDQGVITPVIRKAVSLSAAAALPIFTDKGVNRNIVKKNGISTVVFTPDEIVSSIAVNYVDGGQDFRKATLLIKNQTAELLIGNLFNEKRRDKREKTLSLNLTTSKDQAARVGAITLRERGPLPAGRPNGDIEWVSPIHDAIKLQPIEDIRAISSEHLPSYIQFVRIMELVENPDRMTMTIKARPHFNQFYDDTSKDLDISIFPEGSVQKFPDDEAPMLCRIDDTIETVFIDRQGKTNTRILVKITLPGDALP